MPINPAYNDRCWPKARVSARGSNDSYQPYLADLVICAKPDWIADVASAISVANFVPGADDSQPSVSRFSLDFSTEIFKGFSESATEAQLVVVPRHETVWQ